jgi:hypothetical protein
MSALLRTNEAQLSQVRAGVSVRFSCTPTDTTKERVLTQTISAVAPPRERPVLPNPVQDGNLKLEMSAFGSISTEKTALGAFFWRQVPRRGRATS